MYLCLHSSRTCCVPVCVCLCRNTDHKCRARTRCPVVPAMKRCARHNCLDRTHSASLLFLHCECLASVSPIGGRAEFYILSISTTIASAKRLTNDENQQTLWQHSIVFAQHIDHRIGSLSLYVVFSFLDALGMSTSTVWCAMQKVAPEWRTQTRTTHDFRFTAHLG